ncbi:P-loop containing nucleoside triphosphate hydrolase protein [Hygrophoropsis aurantiaca]|uniref:P-loop containing nucleoside triphosphate hydrolase protein n=1 Tax=Hygrophoropsis aurantiaca TaxID=72124 RepID=A0ACB8A462_9AGAM|nr:P-loop containing nucleoside triphosphate hydrolase protein [Hygrophoropsis aurantiaca]
MFPPEDAADNGVESNWNHVVDSFDNMGLKPELLHGVYAYGFERPSTVQQRIIVPIVKGHDVIVQARSDTGNTATFSIAMLQQLDMSIKGCQALILSPTRELAHAIRNIVVALGKYMAIACHVCIGGTSMREDMARLRAGGQIVVGTPGRVHDMIKRCALTTNNIKTICLDRADEILSRGFGDHITELFRLLPRDIHRQVVFLSTTILMPADALEVTTKFMRNPVRIVERDKLTPELEGIKQFYIAIEKEEWKLDTLFDLYDAVNIKQSVIFCNTRRKVEWLIHQILQRREPQFSQVSAMHCDMEQEQREVLMREFRSDSSRVLITTDLPTPGIEDGAQQPEVSTPTVIMINFDLPTNRENYVHRIGFGRGGRKCVAINFVTTEDVRMLGDIEQFYKMQIKELVDPETILDVPLRGGSRFYLT